MKERSADSVGLSAAFAYGHRDGVRHGGSRPEEERTETDMKLNAGFLLHTAGDQTILVPAGGTEFSGVVQGNKTLRAILELLQTETTEDGIAQELAARFDAPEDTIRKDVRKALDELRKIGALDE